MQKTGTSAVQDWLAASEEELLAQGLLYLRPGRGQPASGRLVRALVRDPAKADRIISGFVSRLKKAAAGDALISSEDFSCHPARLARPLIKAFDGHRIGVLIWLRRQDLFAEALVKQWVKWNGSRAQDMPGFLHHHVRPLLDYDRLLRDWADTFPNVDVVPGIYAEEAPGAPRPDSIRALLTAIGRQDLAPTDAASLRANVSPRADLVRHYATLDQAEDVRRTNRELMRRHGARFAGRGDLIPPAQRDRIRAECLASNERLRARWFPRRERLFDDNEPLTPDPGLGAEAVAAFRELLGRG
ncbi:hypothetical protein [Paracoccus rhizosphaerae]|uniref:Sulfotransferase family protein n=2 Tax=Paracoccus rhizosphaerae TaxID=1133347 RepID=A0ABV6CEY0_9RHOB|nr:hypothetical protein [Paracoccus rhizosphaerae]